MTDTVKNPPTLAMLREKRTQILTIASRHGASNIRIVGSVARGEATSESDVDLLLTTPPRQNVFDLVALWIDIQEELGCDVSVISDSTTDEKFLQHILKDAIPL